MAGLIVLSIIATLNLGFVLGRSNGPPAVTSTCVNMIPASTSPHVKQSGNGTYDVTVNVPVSTSNSRYFSYTAGTQYSGKFSFKPLYSFNNTPSCLVGRSPTSAEGRGRVTSLPGFVLLSQLISLAFNHAI